MSSLSGSSSPDPLHLASSPLSAHAFTRRSVAPPIAHSATTPNPRASPSKSFLMNTGDARIKVTLQSVGASAPRASQSPSKRPTSRTTTIPLRTGESSPARRLRQPTPAAHIDSSVTEVGRRSSRKRKGTPLAAAEMVQMRSSRKQSRLSSERHEQAVEEDHAMFSEQSVPSSEVRRRRSLYPMRNQRNQRLSAARDDLDDALQAAIGEQNAASSDVKQEDYLGSDGLAAGAAGELTAANEDFTMVTGESLASISFKANGTLIGDALHEENANARAVSEHLTSSPPPQDEVAYPDLTGQVNEANTPIPNASHDAMNWKSTGAEQTHPEVYHSAANQDEDDHGDEELEDEIAVDSHHTIVEDDEDPANDSHHPNAEEEQEEVEEEGEQEEEEDEEEEEPVASIRSLTSHKNQHFSPFAREQSHRSSQTSQHRNSNSKAQAEEEATLSAPNPADEQMDEVVEDDDIWAEEASREIDDSAITTTTTRSQSFQRSRRLDRSVVSTTAAAPSVMSERPDRSRRAKLPRTWRQTSGVELSHTDVLAQPAVADKPARGSEQSAFNHNDARSGRRGSDGESGRSSGVLTPPSTDEDDNLRKEENASLFEPAAEEQDIEFKREEEDQEGHPDEAMSEDGLQEAEEQDEAEDEDEEEDISGFTNPGAGDTQLEAHHRFGRHNKPSETRNDNGDIASPFSESGSSVSGEDTGFFWQSNLPQVYRSGKEKSKPQVSKPVDLSAILRMDSSKLEEDGSSANRRSHEQAEPASYSRQQPRRPILEPRRRPAPVATRAKQASTSPDAANGHILPSPLRRSLLRSSKAMDGAPPESSPANAHQFAAPIAHIDLTEETQPTVTDDSFASKASDQRQLLGDFKAATPAKKPAHERLAVLRDSPQIKPSLQHLQKPQSLRSVDASYEETESTFKNSWPEHSYEENLNIESPQKITVNFNDSTLSFQQQEDHSQEKFNPLAPRGPIKPLFQKSANTPVIKPRYENTSKPELSPGPPTITLVGNRTVPVATHQQENEGVFSRLTSTFWSAVARPQGPPPTPAPAARTTEQAISLSLRAQLRSRYGVLPNSHPWTMTHMRTLHRLLNSLESGRRDSIVPTHTPLPPHLASIVDEGRSTATGRSFRFESTHAYVVQAFLQLLVTPSLYQSMEKGEVEWLGDAQAAHFRGEMGGRLGSEVCFKTIKPRRGLIGWEWVVECLGCCVVSNVEMGVRRPGGGGREKEGTVREVEMSIMGDGEGEGRVTEWFERERGGVEV